MGQCPALQERFRLDGGKPASASRLTKRPKDGPEAVLPGNCLAPTSEFKDVGMRYFDRRRGAAKPQHWLPTDPQGDPPATPPRSPAGRRLVRKFKPSASVADRLADLVATGGEAA
jgi:hypothetical protein